ncbi:ATP-binding cassette domain-containing protein [Stieleria sp. JC731]|uniref:ATP-binding cassette domain-containing protein n=1 Tax=Pirellulaceae TaxID=2691357 RepID=UPI001E4BD974|nr:ATP-binding cassette domain-containing protein [Stieleria sp. JC731]MCC9602752.1 ATP-binding cassette domain-containing protein [Stieleria sp. JC731]
MAVLSLANISIGFRGPNLLDEVTAQVEQGDRIGLLGRNGAGKTTLLKMLAGELTPDHGEIIASDSVVIRRLVQDVPQDESGTIEQMVRAGISKTLLSDPASAWQVDHSVERTLSDMQLDPTLDFQSLSSGMKRRVLLARSIVSQPDVLLLDEPTNHLDVESILWLEDFLKRWSKTLIFITHDRSFLQALASRIWEIDRGKLFDWTCDYSTFLKRKEQAIEAEEKQNALFDKRLAEEEAWIRQGIKARRTRNEGRVRRLKEMRVQRQDRQKQVGKAKLSVHEAERSGVLVADVKDMSFAYGDHEIVRDFSTTIMRGDKIGLIGPNGAGKSTLLKLLLGQLAPDSGTVRLGTKLEIAYFDQLRDTLDPEQTVQENVGEGSDELTIGGAKKHILGYLQDYLFTPERARTKVKFLSGGERNRALLAKLMTKPANVLILDEPTNDLDAETLELLEDVLVSFEGTLLLVSHDRTFLNNVVTSTLVFEDNNVRAYVGGYDDWQQAVKRRSDSTPKTVEKPKNNSPASQPAKTESKQTQPPTQTQPAKKKLSYKEQRELDSLPEKIEATETKIAEMHTMMADPAYYQSGGDKVANDAVQLKSLESELQEYYTRWEELEA